MVLTLGWSITFQLEFVALAFARVGLSHAVLGLRLQLRDWTNKFTLQCFEPSSISPLLVLVL